VCNNITIERKKGRVSKSVNIYSYMKDSRKGKKKKKKRTK
jgi:hypothetical protein